METIPERSEIDDRPEVQELLQRLKEKLPALQDLLARCSDSWGYEDPVYRFYHQSFKVYTLQTSTENIVAALKALAPARELNEWFLQIVSEGTRNEFTVADNRRWLHATRPILEAFFHARFFLEVAVKCGLEPAAAKPLAEWLGCLSHSLRFALMRQG